MIKHIINTFIVIAACLGIAAFILVLVKKQNCQTKEPLTTSSCGKLDDKSKSKNIEKYNIDGNDNIGINVVPRSECKGLTNYKTNQCCKVYKPMSNPAKWFVLPWDNCWNYWNYQKRYAWDLQAPQPGDNWGRVGTD